MYQQYFSSEHFIYKLKCLRIELFQGWYLDSFVLAHKEEISFSFALLKKFSASNMLTSLGYWKRVMDDENIFKEMANGS